MTFQGSAGEAEIPFCICRFFVDQKSVGHALKCSAQRDHIKKYHILTLSSFTGLHTQKVYTHTGTSSPQILLLSAHAYGWFILEKKINPTVSVFHVFIETFIGKISRTYFARTLISLRRKSALNF